MTLRPSPDPSFILRGSKSPVTSLAFPSEDILYSGTLGGQVLHWSVVSRRTKAVLDAHRDQPVLWVCSQGNGRLLTQGRDGLVKSWHCADGKWINTGHVGSATLGFCGSAEVTHNNTQLVATPSDITSQVNLYDMDKHHHVMTLKPASSQQKVGMCMSIKPITNQSSGSNHILVGYENGSIMLWDIRTCQCACMFDEAHTESVMCMAFSSQSMKGLSGSVDSKLASWTVNSEYCVKTLGERLITNPGLNDIVVRDDDKLVASAGWDSNIRLFGFKKLKPLAVLSYHRQSAQCLAFSPDNMLACGSKDQLISVWDIYR